MKLRRMEWTITHTSPTFLKSPPPHLDCCHIMEESFLVRGRGQKDAVVEEVYLSQLALDSAPSRTPQLETLLQEILQLVSIRGATRRLRWLCRESH